MSRWVKKLNTAHPSPDTDRHTCMSTRAHTHTHTHTHSLSLSLTHAHTHTHNTHIQLMGLNVDIVKQWY